MEPDGPRLATPAQGTPQTPPPDPPSRLHLDILPQPDDSTCGPTCLHAVYRYFGDYVPLPVMVSEVPQLATGGTLASLLGLHALRRGYRARLYSYDLRTFDPTWFGLDVPTLIAKLQAQMRFKADPKLHVASRAYVDFLREGGLLRQEDLTRALIRRFLHRGTPIIAGLSSTYLYRAMRETPGASQDDDLRGEPGGHFVVLHGYDPEARTVLVADPYADHPFPGTHRYEAPIDRVVCAILLGVFTYDANLLVVEPRSHAHKRVANP